MSLEAASGSSTSRGSHLVLGLLGEHEEEEEAVVRSSETRSGVRDGSREVASRVWPTGEATTARARARPRPEEQPVMSQTRGLEGVVKAGLKVMVVDTMVGKR